MFGSRTDRFKPVQLYHLDTPGVCCQLMSPDDRIMDCIYYYWLLEIEVERVELDVIPDNALDLVMSPMIPGFSALYFPKSEKFSIPLDGPVVYAGVCFNMSHIHQIFREDLSTLKTLSPGLDTAAGLDLRTLVHDIQEKSSAKSIQQCLDQFFLARVQFPDPVQSHTPSPGRFKLLEYMLTNLESQSIQAIAAQAGLSERQFRRVTSSMFGFSPKKIQRIMRLQSALQDLFDTDTGLLSDLYYDDSHRIKELKTLTGLTPGELRKMAENYNQTR